MKVAGYKLTINIVTDNTDLELYSKPDQTNKMITSGAHFSF